MSANPERGLIVQKKPLLMQLDVIREDLRAIEREQNILFHRIAKKGNFKPRPVVISGGSKDEPRILVMKRIGSFEGEVFFYNPLDDMFYSAEVNSKARPKGYDHCCHYVTGLFERNIAWRRLVRLMNSHGVRKIIQEIDQQEGK